MKKRLLAMLLALMLVVSLLPVGVLADDVPEYYRIRDPQALRTAAITKAGYDPDDLAVGIIPTITTRLYTYDGRYSDANSTLLELQYYENTSVDATNRGNVIMPDDIDRIRVTVSFSDSDYDRHTESVIFDKSEFNWSYDMDSIAGGHDVVWLELNNTMPSTYDHEIEFYIQPIGTENWELYDIVYVNAGETLGSNMPAEPNYGTQNFVSWQTQTDGGGNTLKSTTVINEDWVVYGTKTTAGGATAYHVMRDSTSYRYNALQDEVADAYNAEYGTSYTSGNVQISNIQVNGIDGEHTNPIYHSNGWNDDASHYYIYNADAYAAESQPQYRNTRIPVSEVTGITLTGIIVGNSFSVTIPKDELALQEISNPGTSDTIIEISVCDKLDGITKELVESAEDAPADVTGVSYPVNGKVTIPEDGRVTLLYKITVTGDQNAEYIVTDEGATAVSGSLRGELDANGIAEIYVTKTFSADDVVDGVLTNSASLKNDNTTLPPDDGNDKDEVKVEVEDEGGEEPEPEPEPEEPRDPTDTELSKLAVVLECTNDEVEHAEKTKTFHLRTTNSKCEIQQVGEDYICSVTPDYDKILSTYNTATKATHEYEDEGKQFVLTWNASTNAWDVASDPSITRQVKCETPEQPTMYEIYVTVHNGTATFRGSEVTSYILAAENEDITITFTPDEGYTLDYATIDGNMLLIPDGGVYTLKQVDKDHTIEVFYAEDKLGGGDDGTEPDGTPDYRQVFVKYVAADENGVVTPTFDTFNLEVDENGKVMTDDALSLSGVATPNDDATFAYWTIDGPGYDGGAYSYEADLSGKGFTGYVAGQTYTFTAYFNVKPEQPGVYKIDVTVHNGTATFYGSEVTSYILAAENEDITITFTPDEGYTLDYATIDGKMLLIPPDGVYTLKWVDSNHTIEVFYESDKIGGGDDGNEPDGTPDYRQVFVKYVAADGNGSVAPSFDTFNLEVDENGKVMTDDALSLSGVATPNDDATFAYWTIEGLGYDGGDYSYEADLSGEDFTDYVAGVTYTFTAYFNGPVVKPEQPNVYEIYVTVHNGTATFYGSEVTSHILAAENEDITITFTPDEGYTLDYATIDGNMLLIPDDGVYTLKQVDSDHTIEVFYAVDKLGGGDNGNEPDGTPDYRQVFVKYVAADGNGFVTPSFDTFNLEVDENGKVMTDVALSLKGVATPNADATFAYWTIEGLGYDGGAYSYEADLSGEDFTGYVAGETYTFTAYFNGPVVKPEQPNVYEIYVTVHNGTATFCGSEVTSHILAAENEDITITFTPDEGYTLDYATIDGNMLLIPDDGVYTLKQVDSDHTIEVFYESDKIGTEDPNEGDGVPDKYQATVNFVAGENGEVTGDVTKVYTIFGADGKYAEEGVITPSLEGVTVTPDEGYKVDGWTNAADERVNPESEITVEGGDVVVFTVNFQSDPSLKEITSFEKKLVTDRKTYHSFGLRVPTFIRNGSTVVVDEGKGVTLLYAISLTGTPGAEYAITDTGADVADGYALTGVIPETGVVTVYVTKDFTWREAAAAAYKDDALVNTAAVELTDNPNEPGQESTEEVDVVIDWDDPNVPVVPSDPDDDDDDEDEDDEVFVPNWLNTTDHYSYIVGYEDGTIRPGNNITRAEVATIFYRLLSEGSSERWYSASNSFSDVAADSWYNVPVSTLSNMGIIDGYEDGTFKPNASITRAEFTAIATRFFDYTAEYEGAFNDVTYSDWYADCVQAAVDMGLVNGYADGGFHPNAYITRAESCAIVNRVLNRVPHEDHLLDEDEMITWPDNRYGAWYYADMQEATNSHDYDWISVSGEVVEEWTDKLAERDWEALEQQWSTAYSG